MSKAASFRKFDRRYMTSPRLRAAGGDVTDVGLLTWFVKDKAEYAGHLREIGHAIRA